MNKKEAIVCVMLSISFLLSTMPLIYAQQRNTFCDTKCEYNKVTKSYAISGEHYFCDGNNLVLCKCGVYDPEKSRKSFATEESSLLPLIIIFALVTYTLIKKKR